MKRFFALIVTVSVLSFLPTVPVSAQNGPPIRVEVKGHGWGHGRGMGQYGSQGYALLSGWTSAQILDHFYGDTEAGPIPESAVVDPEAVRVEIRSQRGKPLVVDVATAKIHLRDPEGNLLWAADGADEVEGAAVRLTSASGGIRFEQSASCAGPWIEQFVIGPAFIELTPTSTSDGPDGLLRLCQDNGSSTWFDGSLRLNNEPGAMRTTNVVSIEQYLRGVLPAEVPHTWEPAALQSQAVAARSYAMAGDSRQLPYADTCDTTLCQVYRGRYRATSGNGPESSTQPTTDTAIADTAGLVRIRDGVVARTEFSSSTGGYTAGGEFPSVVDEGDAIEDNPNHDWTKVIDLRGFVVAQNKGELLAVTYERNGLGSEGGRVLSVTFQFVGGSTTMSGNQARQTFGLKSDWFTFGELGGAPESPDDYYVIAVYELFLGRRPGPSERETWLANFQNGVAKTALTESLAGSDEWAGVMIDDLYQSVLDRPSDASGRQFWLGRMADGLRLSDVAVNFYGAPEYYDRVGGTDEAYVASLYQNILSREPDAAGLAFWTGALGDGELMPGAVAGGFYASIESREDRVRNVYEAVLGRLPDEEGLGFWANQLLVVDDVALAAALAASVEFYSNAQP